MYRIAFRSKINGREWYSRDPMSHAQAVKLLAYYASWNMLVTWIEPA